VRLETATINRGITACGARRSACARAGRDLRRAHLGPPGVLRLRASCSSGYHQGTNAPSDVLGGVGDVVGVGQRLAKATRSCTPTLSTFGVTATAGQHRDGHDGEEHINEQYGLIDDMVSSGVSGGPCSNTMPSNNAPGLLGAALPGASFPDILVHDHDHRRLRAPGSLISEAAGCSGTRQTRPGRGARRSNAHRPRRRMPELGIELPPCSIRKNGCDASIPGRALPSGTNPKGARCTLQDGNVTCFGRDPKYGVRPPPARQTPACNTIGAFKSAESSARGILDSIEHGGFDYRRSLRSAAHEMDPEVESIAYRIGAVVGRGAIGRNTGHGRRTVPRFDFGPEHSRGRTPVRRAGAAAGAHGTRRHPGPSGAASCRRPMLIRSWKPGFRRFTICRMAPIR